MVSYAITACNERKELENLIDDVLSEITPKDEIVIQLDTTATDEVKEYVNSLKEKKIPNLITTSFSLNGNFSNFKNNLNKFCTKKWIFQLDADETVSSYLLSTLHDILKLNDDKDVILVPRINTVHGLTQQDIDLWKWRVNDKGWINFPDLQWRLFKNDDKISWVNPVHEQLIGFKNISKLPPEPEYCLLHPKTIDRQRKQNEFYKNMFK